MIKRKKFILKIVLVVIPIIIIINLIMLYKFERSSEPLKLLKSFNYPSYTSVTYDQNASVNIDTSNPVGEPLDIITPSAYINYGSVSRTNMLNDLNKLLISKGYQENKNTYVNYFGTTDNFYTDSNRNVCPVVNIGYDSNPSQIILYCSENFKPVVTWRLF